MGSNEQRAMEYGGDDMVWMVAMCPLGGSADDVMIRRMMSIRDAMTR